MKNENLQKIYTIFISLLAITSVALLIMELAGKISLSEQPFKAIDTGILLVFLIDYVCRFVKAEEKRKFFKENIVDLIAIIPFNSIFSAFRMFRMFRLLKASRFLKFARFLRAGAFLTVLRRRAETVLKTNGFIYILYANIVLIVISSFVMMYAENMTFWDALWWSFVTCTTVGYGDISPSSAIGRITAVVLMIFGIGLVGMLTGAITTYFTSRHSGISNASDEETDELQELIQNASDSEKQKILEIARIICRKD